MWRPFLEVVCRSEASVFVIENVPQILDSPEHDQIREAAETMGFRVTSTKLCAADYGVPQVRWRAFIIGCIDSDPASAFPPARTHWSPRQATGALNFDASLAWRTVRDAIGDLPRSRPLSVLSRRF